MRVLSLLIQKIRSKKIKVSFTEVSMTTSDSKSTILHLYYTAYLLQSFQMLTNTQKTSVQCGTFQLRVISFQNRFVFFRKRYNTIFTFFIQSMCGKSHACQIQLWIFRPELKNTDCKKYSNIQRNECTPIGTDL